MNMVIVGEVIKEDYISNTDSRNNIPKHTITLKCFAMGFDNGSIYHVFVREDGSVFDETEDPNNYSWINVEIEPTNLIFNHDVKISESIIDSTATPSGINNYELIYGGTDGKSITITYREFTPNDLARPAFYQNLVYEAKAKQIRFKDTIIRLEQVSNEKITYSVVSDGLKP